MKKRDPVVADIAVLALAALMYIALISPFNVTNAVNTGTQPKFYGKGEAVALVIMLTWDAGAVDRILNTAEKTDLKLSFAVSGDWAAEHPTKISMVYEEGHEILIARNSVSLDTPEEALDELERSADIIERITGERPTYFYCAGEFDRNYIRAAAKAGLKTVSETVDLDSASGTSEDIIDRLASCAKKGSFITCLPTAAFSDALPYFEEIIKKMGLDIVSVHKMLYN